jgi:3',5'-cyclic AMP phosphodiesterase CpdA
MTRLAHLSDLHFGRIHAPALAALRVDLSERAPDLVVVSGDLTQRAQPREFADAAAFLQSLQRPLLVVPGNHDIPLYDVVRRLLFPLRRYKRSFGDDLMPVFEDEHVALVGVNTARSLAIAAGRVSSWQMTALEQRFAAVAPGKLRVVVAHHPFLAPESQPEAALVGRVKRAVQTLERAQVDLVLTGHLHTADSAPLGLGQQAPLSPEGLANTTQERSIVVVQAGTATSSRLRGSKNAYNLIDVDDDAVNIEVRALGDGDEAFVPVATRRFPRGVSSRAETSAASAASPPG